jgi:hypothetical protein
MNCIICGKTGEDHHLLTQKAYPELRDEDWNKMPLCRRHHSQFHRMAATYMANIFKPVRMFLNAKGWKFCETKKKWTPPTYQAKEKAQDNGLPAESGSTKDLDVVPRAKRSAKKGAAISGSLDVRAVRKAKPKGRGRSHKPS